jgi:hypothetical protein
MAEDKNQIRQIITSLYELAGFKPCEAQMYMSEDVELMRGAHSLY